VENNGSAILKQDFTTDTTLITNAINASAPLGVVSQVGIIQCSSWNYEQTYCEIPTDHENPRNFRVQTKWGQPPCTEGEGFWYDSAQNRLYVDKGCRATFEYDYDLTVNNQGGDRTPGLESIAYAASSLNWERDAVKIVVFVSNSVNTQTTDTPDSVDALLKSRQMVLFSIVDVNGISGRVVTSRTSSNSPDGTTEEVINYSDGSTTTIIRHPDGTATSSTSARTSTTSPYGTPNDVSTPSGGGTGLSYDNRGTMYDFEDLENSDIATSLIISGETAGYWDQQPWGGLRFGVGSARGGSNFFPSKGNPMPFVLDEDELQAIRSPGLFTLTGRVRNTISGTTTSGVRGCVVHLKSSITGDTVLATTISDQKGIFAFQVPTRFFPRAQVQFTVEAHLYDFRMDDPEGLWEISTTGKEAGATQYLALSGAGLSLLNEEVVYTIPPFQILRTDAGLDQQLTIRGLHTGGGSPFQTPDAFQRATNFRVENGRLTFDLQFDDTHGGDLDFNDMVVKMQYVRADGSPGRVSCLPSSDGPLEPSLIITRQALVDDISRTFFSIPVAGHNGLSSGANGLGISNIGDITPTGSEISTIQDAFRDCGDGGFLQRLAKAIYDSIQDFVPKIDANCLAPVSGGPATEYSKVSGIRMTETTLDGNVVAVQATLTALPGTAISAQIYDIYGRGIRMRPIDTLPTQTWETHSWQVDNVDRYINHNSNTFPVIEQLDRLAPGGAVDPNLRPPSSETTNTPDSAVQQPALNKLTSTDTDSLDAVQAASSGDERIATTPGRLELLTKNLEIKLRDLSSLSFEFINPDTGTISYFSDVKVAVEQIKNERTGETEIVLVDVSNMEPFGETLSDPGDIPLVVYGGAIEAETTAGEDDGSESAEATLTLAGQVTNRDGILLGGPQLTETGGFVGGSQVINFVDSLNLEPFTAGYLGHQVLIDATLEDTLNNLCDLINGGDGQDTTWHNALDGLEFEVSDFVSNSGIVCAGVDTTGSLPVITFAAADVGINGNSYIARATLDQGGVMAFGPSTMGTFSGGIDAPEQPETEPVINFTEEDVTAYLENFWRITEPDNPNSPNEFERLKEFCPDCTVVKCDNTDQDALRRETIECIDKNSNILVPLNKFLFTPIAPCESCLMHWKQVEWYERGWRTSNACGAFVEIDGMQWIVVKRSIGIDTSCGGGESENTQCIKQFIEAGQGHPAIAWPSIDGEEFIGRPTSGFARFVKDPGLSDAIIEAMANHQARSMRGNLTAGNTAETIPFILFPRSL
jgi:hypothetical protein